MSVAEAIDFLEGQPGMAKFVLFVKFVCASLDPGGEAKATHSDDGTLQMLFFQDSRMRQTFHLYPEVLFWMPPIL
jgi:hypothetical protein